MLFDETKLFLNLVSFNLQDKTRRLHEQLTEELDKVHLESSVTKRGSGNQAS